MFLIVEGVPRTTAALESSGLKRVTGNSGHDFMPELTEDSIRLSNDPNFTGDIEVDPPALILTSAQRWHYPLELLTSKDDNRYPPLLALLSGLVDTWLDSTTPQFSAHVSTHLAYMWRYASAARMPSFADQLILPHQQEFWRAYAQSAIRSPQKAAWRRRRQELMDGARTA